MTVKIIEYNGLLIFIVLNIKATTKVKDKAIKTGFKKL